MSSIAIAPFEEAQSVAATTSPTKTMNQRRWENFKKNRRGFYSCWILLGLFALSMASELVANDKPLLVRFNGNLYAPVLVSYPEAAFGGEFETEADYRDPFVKNLIKTQGWMLWPPIRFSYDTINYDLEVPSPAPPGPTTTTTAIWISWLTVSSTRTTATPTIG